jgi:hypothetical protein
MLSPTGIRIGNTIMRGLSDGSKVKCQFGYYYAGILIYEIIS